MSRIDWRLFFLGILPVLVLELAITNQWRNDFDDRSHWIVFAAIVVCAPIASITILERMGERGFWLKFMAPIFLCQIPFIVALEQQRRQRNVQECAEERRREDELQEQIQKLIKDGPQRVPGDT